MQQYQKICINPEHENRQITCICLYPECHLSRFLCWQCQNMENHKHYQQQLHHIVDNRELQRLVQDKLKLFNGGEVVDMKKRVQIETGPLKQLIQKIQDQLTNILNMVKQIEFLNMYQDSKAIFLKELLQNIQSNGFNKIEDNQLFMLINIEQLDPDVCSYLSNQAILLSQSVTSIQEWCDQQKKSNSIQWKEKIQQVANTKRLFIIESQRDIQTTAISNDFKYIASGGKNRFLRIWSFDGNALKKTIKFEDIINHLKFTEDSSLLYVGSSNYLYVFDFKNDQFNQIYKKSIHQDGYIMNICCLSNDIVLTSSSYGTIIKTNICVDKKIFQILAHDRCIPSLDYNRNLNVIASASSDKSIKLWNGNTGQLVLDAQPFCRNTFQLSVQFIINKNQLLSLDEDGNVIIWKINFKCDRLELVHQIQERNGIFSASLILDQQYIGKPWVH